jgi:hypothetical protein
MVKRLGTSQTEEKAVLLMEAILNKANWVSNRLHKDFGVDLHVKVFESGEPRKAMPWEFHIQVKGTERLRVSRRQVRFAIDTDHLYDWYETTLPVLFTVCDVNKEIAYYLWIKEYMEEARHKLEGLKYHYLSIPEANRLTPDALPHLLADLKRAAFTREAQNVIALVEQSAEWDDPFMPRFNQYEQHLLSPDKAIQDPALAKCIMCQNYFWIEESGTAGWDTSIEGDDIPLNCFFTKIYEPFGHQPAVYSCDAPEEYCPFCTSDRGPLKECKECGKYQYPYNEGEFGEWDDPLITLDEVKILCSDCLENLRECRRNNV